MNINRRRFLKSSAAFMAAASCGDISQTYAHLQSGGDTFEYTSQMQSYLIAVQNETWLFKYVPEKFKTAGFLAETVTGLKEKWSLL